MKKYINDFILMLQFLTRIPINLSLQCEKENFRRGGIFLPLVGFIIGGLQWGVSFLIGDALPSNITAVLVVLIGVLVTGALHVDGLGDTCDGFYAFKGRDRIIEIMKDSRIGTFACIAIVMDLLLKVLITALLIDKNLSLLIIVIPVVARFSIVLLSYIGKPAKATGSGNLFIGNMNLTVVFLSAAIGFILSYFMVGVSASIIIFLAAIGITVFTNLYSNNKIGGLTGDLLGANNELVETLAVLVYLIVYSSF